jgi:hypothetical protein
MSTTRIAALTLSASALIFAACTSAVMAQRGANACVAEMMAQCPGVQPGEGRIRACFRDHFKDFSKSCQAFILKGALVNGPPRFPPPEQAGLGIGGRPFPPPESIGSRPFPRAPGTASSAEGKRHLKKRGADKSGASSGERRVEASTSSTRPHKASAKTFEAPSPQRQRLSRRSNNSEPTTAGYHRPTDVPLDSAACKALFKDFLEWQRQQSIGQQSGP